MSTLQSYMPRECLIDNSDCGHGGCPIAEWAKQGNQDGGTMDAEYLQFAEREKARSLLCEIPLPVNEILDKLEYLFQPIVSERDRLRAQRDALLVAAKTIRAAWISPKEKQALTFQMCEDLQAAIALAEKE